MKLTTRHALTTAAWALGLMFPVSLTNALASPDIAVIVSGVVIGVVAALWRETLRRRRMADDAIRQLAPGAIAAANVAVACAASPRNMAVVTARGAESDADNWHITPGLPRVPEADQ